ncbi:50S ribosomal protein L25 [Candidatus Berkelbacteria bacterium]|nr:50S ribosomal protein L25 [Candidatus Berkelbacteria bacterium]
MTADKLSLVASERAESGKVVKRLRAAGKLPAIVYGHDTEATSVALDTKEFTRVYHQAGGNTLIDLKLGARTIKVLIQEVQRDPVYDRPLHADLYAVNLKETVETEVPLKFVGESPAVKDLEGNLVINVHKVELAALPTEIPHEIEVDISVLKTFEDMIRAADLTIPAGVELLLDADQVIALVAEQEEEEVVETTAADAEAAAVAELGAKPEEGETATEGEAPAEEKKREE